MTVTVGDTLPKVRGFLRDENSSAYRWSDAKLVGYLADAALELVRVRGDANSIREALQLTASAVVHDILPADAMELLDVTRNMGADGATAGNAILMATLDEMNRADRGWISATPATTILNWLKHPAEPTRFYTSPPAHASTPVYVETVYSRVPKRMIYQSFAQADVELATSRISLPGHALENNSQVLLPAPASGSTLPGGLSARVIYYALVGMQNLLTYSEQFDNAAWAKPGCSVTANAEAAPDGTVTMDKIVEDGTTGVHAVAQTKSGIESGGNIVASVHGKADERSQIYVLIQNSGGTTSYARAIFDLASGVVSGVTYSNGAAAPQGGAAKMVLESGSWRCSLPVDLPAGETTAKVLCYLYNGGISYAGDGASGLYLWGAQLNDGPTPLPYVTALGSPIAADSDTLSLAAASGGIRIPLTSQGVGTNHIDSVLTVLPKYKYPLQLHVAGSALLEDRPEADPPTGERFLDLFYTSLGGKRAA